MIGLRIRRLVGFDYSQAGPPQYSSSIELETHFSRRACPKPKNRNLCNLRIFNLLCVLRIRAICVYDRSSAVEIWF